MANATVSFFSQPMSCKALCKMHGLHFGKQSVNYTILLTSNSKSMQNINIPGKTTDVYFISWQASQNFLSNLTEIPSSMA